MKILYNLYAISGFLNAILGAVGAIVNFCLDQYDYMIGAVVLFFVGVVHICLHRQLYNDVQMIKQLEFKVEFLLNQAGHKNIASLIDERDEELE